MDRNEFDANQSLIAGTWQNRQGRENEWTPASKSDARGVLAIIVVCCIALVGGIAAVL